MYLIFGIIGVIIFFSLLSAYAKHSEEKLMRKTKNKMIEQGQNALEQIGKLEGKPISDIKAVIGEPKNVEIVDGSRILTWPGLQLLCTNDKEMIVKEVLKNIYK